MQLRLCVPCLLGLEGPISEELKKLGMKDVLAENGRVYFSGGPEAVATANICLRMGERVLIELGSFRAESFDELFEGTKALPWESIIPRNGAFPVKGHSLNSKLFSVSDCQSIIKKAVAVRLGRAYGLTRLPEGRGDFCDPFCGSGTIPIEAALIAKNRAPGLRRDFASAHWQAVPEKLWQEARSAAIDREFHGQYSILGSDIDPEALELAKANARRAGVDDVVRFELADATKFSRSTERGVIVTNPPYGERIMEKEQAQELYRGFGQALEKCSGWQLYLLSSHTEFERCFGKPADKKRKLYNGMIKCDLYMYR